ncbi:MAG TPA: SDR family oxidoreductase [Streptosporangiaceae bacterium]|nr:SDR family oxidoreductase [Streptosporangiaceae bacterium]
MQGPPRSIATWPPWTAPGRQWPPLPNSAASTSCSGNAGLLITAPLAEWSAEQWDLTVAVNLRAPFLLAQAATPWLTESPHASLILTASTGAFRGHAGMPAPRRREAAGPW